MNAVIGVFESHETALVAIQTLQQSGYPAGQLSVIGKADLVNNHIHVKSSNTAEKAEVSIGVIAGAVLGILTGVGIFAIPGLGFLYGAGALVGVFAGVDFGIIAGGLAAVFTSMGVDSVNAVKYEKRLNEGKFIVFAQGDEKEIEHAHEVLHTQGLHLELDHN